MAELRGGLDLVGLLEALGMEDDYEMFDVRVAAGEEDMEVEEEVMKRLRRSGLGENGWRGKGIGMEMTRRVGPVAVVLVGSWGWNPPVRIRYAILGFNVLWLI